MKITWISFFLVICLFILVFESVRRGILETKYSILWMITCFILAILSLNEGLINKLGFLVNVYYPPSLLFLLGLFFSLLLIFDLTRRVSKLNKELINLTQEYTIMKEKISEKDH